ALISNVWEVGVDDDITTFRERSQEVGVHSGSRVVFRRAVLRVLVHSVLPAAIVVAAIHVFFFSSRRRHTRSKRDWSSDVGSSDLNTTEVGRNVRLQVALREPELVDEMVPENVELVVVERADLCGVGGADRDAVIAVAVEPPLIAAARADVADVHGHVPAQAALDADRPRVGVRHLNMWIKRSDGFSDIP